MSILAILAALAGLGAVVGMSASGSSDSDGGSTTDDPASSATEEEDLFEGIIEDAPVRPPVAAPISEDPADPVAVPEGSDIPDSAYDLDWDGLTAEEQLVVELVNRARLDPDGEAARQGVGFASGVDSTPKEALAVVQSLSDAARGHSEDMDNRDFFAHVNLDGESPADRALEADHGSRFVGENIGWIGSSRTSFDAQGRIESHHDNLWASPGHQQNLMSDHWSEIGTGVDYGEYRGLAGSTFVTEKFGDRGDTFLTGVVIDDEDGDEFYDIGEGQGDVRITAYKDDEEYTTATWESGGYSLALDPGTYRVVFEGGDLDAPQEETVMIGAENVKLDIIENSGGGGSSTLAAGPDEMGTAQETLPSAAESGEVFLTDLLPDTSEPGWEDVPYVDEAEDALMAFA